MSVAMTFWIPGFAGRSELARCSTYRKRPEGVHADERNDRDEATEEDTAVIISSSPIILDISPLISGGDGPIC